MFMNKIQSTIILEFMKSEPIYLHLVNTWDFLMLVYSKIIHLDIEPDNEWQVRYSQLHSRLIDANKEGFVEAIIDFIKWYNKKI